MSTHHDFCLARAEEALRDAEAAKLANVRERCLRSAAVWNGMAERAARTERKRAETDARKTGEADDARHAIDER